MTAISEQVKELRHKADVFEKSGWAVDGITKSFRDAADTIEALSVKLAAAQYGDGWIYCGDGKDLPEESLNSVIGWDEYRQRCCFVQYWGGRWILKNDVDSVKISAWMPAPTKPRYEP